MQSPPCRIHDLAVVGAGWTGSILANRSFPAGLAVRQLVVHFRPVVAGRTEFRSVNRFRPTGLALRRLIVHHRAVVAGRTGQSRLDGLADACIAWRDRLAADVAVVAGRGLDDGLAIAGLAVGRRIVDRRAVAGAFLLRMSFFNCSRSAAVKNPLLSSNFVILNSVSIFRVLSIPSLSWKS